MDEDERLNEIKRFLEATINEFESLFKSAGGFEDSRIGNGWNPVEVEEGAYVVPPIEAAKAQAIAESRKRSLFENSFLTILGPRRKDIQRLEGVRLRYLPFWKVNGFHECFYFRGSEYSVKVPDDVIAIEVEGKVRDLISEQTRRKLTMDALRRLVSGNSSPRGHKFFRLDGATELAYKFDQASFLVNGAGDEDLEAEDFLSRKPPARKLASIEELRLSQPEAEVVIPALGKEDLVERLHQRIVKPPAAFSKILSNRFEVTDLDLYFVPNYFVRFRHGIRVRELRIHGATGEVIR